MNKKYIDFVPNQKKSSPKETVIVEETFTSVFLSSPEPIAEKIFEEVAEEAPKPQDRAQYGVIESYSPLDAKRPVFKKDVKVEKRPLSTPAKPRYAQDFEVLKAAKAENLKKKPLNLAKDKKSVPETAKKPTLSSSADFSTPKNPFINTKVEKRPLSKNVYKPTAAKDQAEEKSTPVRIVEDKKKSSKLSTVVGIILTIIIGAIVGTVAFLLIQK